MKLIASLLFSLIFALASAQSTASPTDKLGAWYMLDGTHEIADKWSLKTGFHLRTFEVYDNLNLLFYYSGVNYKPNSKTTVTIGYCYLDIDRTYAIAGESHLYENRPYGQISYKHQILNLPITHRLRLEHRFLNYNHDHNILHRFRYRLGSNINLSERVFFYINEELFINTKDDIFTENRLGTGFGLVISKANTIKIGYLNHEINRQNFNRVQIGIFINTDLRNKSQK